MAKKKPAAKKSAKTKAPSKKAAKKPVKKPAKKAAAKRAAAPTKKAVVKKAAPKAAAKSKTKISAKPAPKAKPAVKGSAPTKAARVGAVLDGLFTPLDDRLIIEAEGESNRTAGGLYIPDSVGASDRPKRGKVVAVGRGHLDKKGRLRPLDVQVGDMVMFETYQGSQMMIGDRELVVLRESQVLGIVK